MRWVEMICCARSMKHSNYCVAGVRTDSGEWIRPVSAAADGAVRVRDCQLDNGLPIQKLDVVRVPVGPPAPRPHQPENVVIIDDHEWQFVRRAGERDVEMVRAKLECGPALFGDTERYRLATDLEASPVASSLGLLDVSEAEVERWQYEGRPRVSLAFWLAGTYYELGLTDPEYRHAGLQLDIGTHRMSAIGIEAATQVLALASIAEPFDGGKCYKVIASLLRA